MKSSCLRHPKQNRFIIVREWQIRACRGNKCAAALLSFMEYWHNLKLDQQRKANKANDVAEFHGDPRAQDESLKHFHNEADLITGLLLWTSENTIRQAVELLIELDFISIHRNPTARYKFDKTRYFLLHVDVVQKWIDDNCSDAEEASPQDDGEASLTFEAPSRKSEPSSLKSEGLSRKSKPRRGTSEPQSLESEPSSTNKSFKQVLNEPSQAPTAAALEAPGADAGAVVESFDSLSGAEPQVLAAAPRQDPIPGVVVAQPDAESEERINSIAQRLVHWAESLGRVLDAKAAVRMTRRQPLSLAGPGELLRALTEDRAAARLDDLIPRAQAEAMATRETERLRWHLIAWPGHPESTAEFWASKAKRYSYTSCFLKRFKADTPPPAEWLDDLLDQDKREMHQGRRATQQAAAAGVWAVLSEDERSAFERDLKERPPMRGLVKGNAMPIPRHTAEFAGARDERLLAPDLREHLAQVLAAPEVPALQMAPRLAPELELARAERAQVTAPSPSVSVAPGTPSMSRIGDVTEDVAQQMFGDSAPPRGALRGGAIQLTGEEKRAQFLLLHKLQDGEIEPSEVDSLQEDWDDASWARIKNATLPLIEKAA